MIELIFSREVPNILPVTRTHHALAVSTELSTMIAGKNTVPAGLRLPVDQPHKIMARKTCRRLDPRRHTEGGRQVQRSRQQRVDRAPRRQPPRPTHKQRHPHHIVVHHVMLVDHAVPATKIPVVTRVDHQRVLRHPQGVQTVKQPPNLVVDQRHHPQIARHNRRPTLPPPPLNPPRTQLLTLNIGLVGQWIRKTGPRLQPGRIHQRSVGLGRTGRQMRLLRIPTNEKWTTLLYRSVKLLQHLIRPPARCTLRRGRRPIRFAKPSTRLRRQPLLLAPDPIVGSSHIPLKTTGRRRRFQPDRPLAHIAQPVAPASKQLAEKRQPLRRRTVALTARIHQTAMLGRVEPGQQRSARRCAHRNRAERLRKIDPSRRQTIQIGRRDSPVAVHPQRIGAVLVNMNQ